MTGVNNLSDFNKVDSLFQNRLVNKFLAQGVLIKKPETSYFSYNTKIAKKVIIEPNVIIRNNVTIKSGSIIKSYSDLGAWLIVGNVCDDLWFVQFPVVEHKQGFGVRLAQQDGLGVYAFDLVQVPCPDNGRSGRVGVRCFVAEDERCHRFCPWQK